MSDEPLVGGGVSDGPPEARDVSLVVGVSPGCPPVSSWTLVGWHVDPIAVGDSGVGVTSGPPSLEAILRPATESTSNLLIKSMTTRALT